MGNKLKPIFIEIEEKKILIGTIEINEEHNDPVYHPLKITDISIKKINLNRQEGDRFALSA